MHGFTMTLQYQDGDTNTVSLADNHVGEPFTLLYIVWFQL